MRVSSLLATLFVVATSQTEAAQNIPNPVKVVYDFKAPGQTYNVDCWSTPGIRGTWLAVTGTTFTTQQALIYVPQPPSYPAPVKSSILYCFASDGKPGIIAGAPQGLILPPQSRVQAYPTVVIMLHGADGRTSTVATAASLEDDARIDSGPSGIVWRRDDHDVTIYPPGSTLTLGGGEGYAYFRPGQTLGPVMAEANEAGCTVSYINSRNEVSRTRHYAHACPEISADVLLKTSSP